jgi:predicted HAD superfamily phosphohydrolase
MWKIASGGYAMGARGTTYVIRTATIRTKSVWLTVEKPIIEFFDKIDELIEIITG